MYSNYNSYASACDIIKSIKNCIINMYVNESEPQGVYRFLILQFKLIEMNYKLFDCSQPVWSPFLLILITENIFSEGLLQSIVF